MIMSIMFWPNFGPVYKQSFRDGPFVMADIIYYLQFGSLLILSYYHMMGR